MRNELLDKNLRFYDSLWTDAHLVEPQRFNTWPLVRSLLTDSGRRLEVAPGLRPRLPIEGTQFVDIDDDDGALSELSRVTRIGGTVLISTPLHVSRWTGFDEFVGHRRRYEPSQLFAKLAQHRFSIGQSAVFGMQPRSTLLLNFGMWWLTHHRERAMRLYNRKLMPLGLRFQKKLKLVSGALATDGIDEILLVCQRYT
jgi:hypothetical protein